MDVQDQQAEVILRPTTDDHDEWKAYWKAQGMPWRTEPEIAEERQQYLAERRAITPNILKGMYPFKDIELDRADIEWLLATHESGGVYGPVDWVDTKQREREGIDIRAALLQDVDLSCLPLARLHAGLSRAERTGINTHQRRATGARLERVDFSGTHLEGATLTWTHLEGANLYEACLQQAELDFAHCEAANLYGVNLAGASIRRTYFDVATYLKNAKLSDASHGSVSLADVRWGETDIATINWSHVTILGDELQANRRWVTRRVRKGTIQRLEEYGEAVRANRQLAIELREQGLSEDADRFAYKAQKLQRHVLWHQRRYGAAFGSWLLDVIAGYGYKPMHTLTVYLLALISFATAYFILGQTVGPHLSPLGAFVFSMTSFHGRGFFPGGIVLDDPITVLAAFEAFVGLVVEVSFIATFTQRFFAR